jgi:phenylpropionate dioxygenase-like ring-hydroxylating dioxygenase large terminal subunit
MTDPAAFAHEQAQLGRVWTVLGLTSDLPNDGDWFRATLGGRSVFVQRFGDTLRGFENRCAHRFYPLRTADKGTGVIRCGFHHWQYDKEGRAVGIPQCLELFGMTPRQLGARLNPVEISTCGLLVFGRFVAPDATETLEQYLGEGFPILQALCNRTRAPYYMSRIVEANWKLVVHVSLDDYHIVAVHPTTFGKTGYLSTQRIRYFRFGWHNAFLNATDDDNALAKMAAACRDGSYRPPSYRILQFFPNFSANHTRAVDRWFVTLHSCVPLAVDRTLWRFWYYPAPFPIEDRGWLRNLRYRLTAPVLPLGVRFYGGRVADEDKAVAERLQSTAHQVDGSPILGLQEERIAWFEEAYAEALAATPVQPAA